MSTVQTESGTGVWSRLWRNSPSMQRDAELLECERVCPRWMRLESALIEAFGSIRGLRTIELGSGRGDLSVLLARAGAQVSLLDYCPDALDQARSRFDRLGLDANFIQADFLKLPADVASAFDLSVSLGVVEHFRGCDRTRAISAHREVIHDRGLSLISVPHARCVPYRLWKGYLELRGWWPYGMEIPYNRRELVDRCAEARLDACDLFAWGFNESIREHWGRNLLHRQWNRPRGTSRFDATFGLNLVMIARAM